MIKQFKTEEKDYVLRALVEENKLSSLYSNSEEFNKLISSDFIEGKGSEAIALMRLKNTDVIARAFEYIGKNEKIVVCGDYDCDGIMGTVILLEGLRILGYENVDFVIPNRIIDGYGLKDLESLENYEDIKVVITTDVGISEKIKIDKLLEKGIKVFVTDHHLPGGPDTIPNCTIVDPSYNPDQIDTNICGAVVSLKVMYEMMLTLSTNIIANNFLNMMLPFAGIATVADMMPMVGINRDIVRDTLTAFTLCKSSTRRYLSLKDFIRAYGGYYFINNEDQVPDENLISFFIAPTVNAVSRIKGDVSSVILDLRYAISDKKYISSRSSINYERKKLTADIISRAKIDIDDESPVRVVILNEEDYNTPIKGVLGLIANRIADKTNKVTLVGIKKNQDEKSFYDFSGRSVSGYDLHSAINRISEYLPNDFKYGGHSAAMGLRFFGSQEDIDKMSTALSNDFVKYAKLEEKTYYQFTKEVESEVINTLLKYSPFGQGWKTLNFVYRGEFKNLADDEKSAIIGDYIFRTLTKDTSLIGKTVDVTFNISFDNVYSSTFRVKEIKEVE